MTPALVGPPPPWSDVGRQIVNAAHESGSRAFSDTPGVPQKGLKSMLVPPPSNHPAAHPPPTQPPLRAERGPFDPGGAGDRRVGKPEVASLPEAMRYPQCATAVPLPTRWDTQDVPRSAQPPSQELRRSVVGGVRGYNGNGIHSRAPNLIALPGGIVAGGGGGRHPETCHAAGRLCVVTDVSSGAQRCYEAHTQLVTCIAVHPSGDRLASAQLGHVADGTDGYASVWDVATLRELARVGWSHAADGGAGSGGVMKPCFERGARPRHHGLLCGKCHHGLLCGLCHYHHAPHTSEVLPPVAHGPHLWLLPLLRP